MANTPDGLTVLQTTSLYTDWEDLDYLDRYLVKEVVNPESGRPAIEVRASRQPIGQAESLAEAREIILADMAKTLTFIQQDGSPQPRWETALLNDTKS